MSQRDSNPWFPFDSNELQLVLGVFGFGATLATVAGVGSVPFAVGSAGFLACAYLAGLLVHARRAARSLTFWAGGAVAGQGCLDSFRRVRRCLYLMHIDDDAPSEELQALYRRLLARGVQIRRIIFLRSDAELSAYNWIVQFGDHENLQQRIVMPTHATAMRFSFALVDDAAVLLSVPGVEPIDGSPYTKHFMLRHLLRIEDQRVASVFLKIHGDLWQRAEPMPRVATLATLVAEARAGRGRAAPLPPLVQK